MKIPEAMRRLDDIRRWLEEPSARHNGGPPASLGAPRPGTAGALMVGSACPPDADTTEGF
jgi:hypothetical protein